MDSSDTRIGPGQPPIDGGEPACAPEPGLLAGVKAAWRIECGPDVSAESLLAAVVPALSAVPSPMAERIGMLDVRLVAELSAPADASEWQWEAGAPEPGPAAASGGAAGARSTGHAGLRVSVAVGEVEAHDVALELLTCLGQALWEKLRDREKEAFLRQIGAEISDGVEGEMDEAALREKRALMSIAFLAHSRRSILRYARAAFAASAAEYVHALWHDVTVRRGRDFLPPHALRARLKLLESCFPPDPGYRLFPD